MLINYNNISLIQYLKELYNLINNKNKSRIILLNTILHKIEFRFYSSTQ